MHCCTRIVIYVFTSAVEKHQHQAAHNLLMTFLLLFSNDLFINCTRKTRKVIDVHKHLKTSIRYGEFNSCLFRLTSLLSTFPWETSRMVETLSTQSRSLLFSYFHICVSCNTTATAAYQTILKSKFQSLKEKVLKIKVNSCNSYIKVDELIS